MSDLIVYLPVNPGEAPPGSVQVSATG